MFAYIGTFALSNIGISIVLKNCILVRLSYLYNLADIIIVLVYDKVHCMSASLIIQCNDIITHWLTSYLCQGKFVFFSVAQLSAIEPSNKVLCHSSSRHWTGRICSDKLSSKIKICLYQYPKCDDLLILLLLHMFLGALGQTLTMSKSNGLLKNYLLLIFNRERRLFNKWLS